jgi:hypothetical protein
LVVGLALVSVTTWLIPWNRLESGGALRLTWLFGGEGLAVWWAFWGPPRAFDVALMSALFVLTAAMVVMPAGIAFVSRVPYFDPVLTAVLAWQALTLYALGGVWRRQSWGRRTLMITSTVEIAFVVVLLVRTTAPAAGVIRLVPTWIFVLYGLRAASALVVLNRAGIRRSFGPVTPQAV